MFTRQLPSTVYLMLRRLRAILTPAGGSDCTLFSFLGQLVVSGGAKLVGAGLSYVMLVLIGRASSATEFGIFSAAFSLAILVSFLGNFGQPQAVMRFEQQWAPAGAGDRDGVAVFLGLLSVTACLLVFGLVLVGVAAALPDDLWFLTPSLALSVALLALMHGVAEFLSAALRCRGYLALALLPRDVAWRAAICLIVGGFLLTHRQLGALGALVLTTTGLGVCLLPQLLAVARLTRDRGWARLSSAERREYRRTSSWLWVLNMVSPLVGTQAGVVVVATFIGAEAAGGYFAAERTAYVLTLALLAVNMVAGPLISRYYYSNDLAMARFIAALSGVMSLLISALGFIFVAFFAGDILTLFNSEYADYSAILLALALGQFINGSTGPVAFILQITGHERALLAISSSVGGAALFAQIAMAYIGNPLWVAVVAGTSTGAINLVAFGYAYRVMGIDTMGIFYLVSRAVRVLRKGDGYEDPSTSS